MFVGLNSSFTQLVTICVTVFLTDVLDCYALMQTVSVFIVLHLSICLSCFVLYNWNDLNHRRPVLMALTFPAEYQGRQTPWCIHIAICRRTSWSIARVWREVSQCGVTGWRSLASQS